MRLDTILLFLLFFLSSCGLRQVEAESEPKWLTGAGPARGHEDLTRIAVDRANNTLQNLLGYKPYPSIAKGVAGLDTGHPMVKGNYETDFPTTKMYQFHGMPSSVDWHNDGRLQHLHSLRDYPDRTPLGLRASCLAVRSSIVRAAHKAMGAFGEGDRDSGLYWLGHATHIIQDSFSPAHTPRTGEGRRVITDLCVYGLEWPGICKHETVDLRDHVWRSTFACQFDPNNRNHACLKSEAQDAVHATTAFLINAGEAIFAGNPFDDLLQGFFACETLTP